MSDIPTVNIIQSVAILIDGNNIERSLHSMTKDDNVMINFDNLIPKLLKGRGLSRLIYFREGNQISSKLADRLLNNYMGSVVPCHKSADIPLSISATQIARKVDTIIILSGDSDYVELVRHLKGEGVRIEIAAVKATTAQILIDESDHFIEINEEDSFSLTPKRGSAGKRSTSKSRSVVKTKAVSTKSSTKKENKPNSRKETNKAKPKADKKVKARNSRTKDNKASKGEKGELKSTKSKSNKKASKTNRKPSNKGRSKQSNNARKKPILSEQIDDFSY